MKEQGPDVATRMEMIHRVLLVLSGKGGVGKSTVAANLAVELARRGHRTGLLDIDVHGPSIPGLLGLAGRTIDASENGMVPVQGPHGLKVISVGFLIGHPEDAVIWRGPMKTTVITQLISDVDWGGSISWGCPSRHRG